MDDHDTNSNRRKLSEDFTLLSLLPSPPDRGPTADQAPLGIDHETFSDLPMEELDHEAGLAEIDTFYGFSPEPSPKSSPNVIPSGQSPLPAESAKPRNSPQDAAVGAGDEFDGLMEDIENYSSMPQETDQSFKEPDAEDVFTTQASPQLSTPRRLSTAVFEQSPLAYSPRLPEESPTSKNTEAAPLRGTPLPPSSGNRSQLHDEMREEEREPSVSPKTPFRASLKERLRGAQATERALSQGAVDNTPPDHATSSTQPDQSAEAADTRYGHDSDPKEDMPGLAAYDTSLEDHSKHQKEDPEDMHVDAIPTKVGTEQEQRMKRPRQSPSPSTLAPENRTSPVVLLPAAKKQKVEHESQEQDRDQKPTRQLRNRKLAPVIEAGGKVPKPQLPGMSLKPESAASEAKPNTKAIAAAEENSDSSLTDLSSAPQSSSPMHGSNSQETPSAKTKKVTTTAGNETASTTTTTAHQNPRSTNKSVKSKPERNAAAPKSTPSASARSTPKGTPKGTPSSAKSAWIKRNRDLSSLVGDTVLAKIIQTSPRKTRGQRKADEEAVPSGAAAAKKRHSGVGVGK